MILDGVCYSAIQFRRVILPLKGYCSPLVVSLLLTSTILYVEYIRLRASIDAPVPSPDAPLLMIRSKNHLFKPLDLLFGVDA